MAETVYYSALHWAKKAEASARLAADLAQTEGKVIQLGFDGSMQDGQLVFKHAPGGVEVPYQLVDDVEYELDLAYNGDLDSLTTMVVKNDTDTINFVSALHRSSTEPARVADMDAVMRYDATTGYRWLFKATFKIAPNGAKVFLLYPVVAKEDTSKITNCITEIPQDIKLELVDGVLTLKAGSKVYVPNGAGKFDEVVVSSDLTFAYTGATTGTMFIAYDTTTSRIFGRWLLNGVGSGTSTPTTSYWLYYNTNDNICYNVNNTTGVKASFPICTVTVLNNNIQSIDQVFNGFGYIGSTVFALPGVKGLIPNGRNEDGTLKNTEFTVDKVLTLTGTGSNKGVGLYINDKNILFYGRPYSIFKSLSNVPATFSGIGFILDDNVLYTFAFGVVQNRQAYCVGGVYDWTSNNITSFTPKLPFRAVDYSDSLWVARQAMPSDKYIVLTLGATGTSYTAPANGWLYIAKAAGTVSNVYVSIESYKGSVRCVNGGLNVGLYALLPMTKGSSATVYYTATGTTNYFRFIYAEGEN